MSRTSGVARGMGSSERIGRQRQAAAARPLVRDKYNPSVDFGQTALDWVGVGVNKSTGQFEVDPTTLAMSFFPMGKLGKLGKVAKALIPKGKRIASAATRVSEAATLGKRARLSQVQALRSGAQATMDEARKLQEATHVGSDFYQNTSRQVDPLFDKWETTSTRMGQGDGASAWQRAQDLARQTGRRVHKYSNNHIPGAIGESFKLLPTSEEIARSEAMYQSAGRQVHRADDIARQHSILAGNEKLAKKELERRLKALKTGPVRKEPFRKPGNSAL